MGVTTVHAAVVTTEIDAAAAADVADANDERNALVMVLVELSGVVAVDSSGDLAWEVAEDVVVVDGAGAVANWLLI